jgi:hypothetical protein
MPRKHVKRAFAGLVGRPPEFEDKPAAPAPPAPPTPDKISALVVEFVAAKRGRPKKFESGAEKQAAYRARTAQRIAIEALQHKHRDDAGRFHGEISGGDAARQGDATKWRPGTDGRAFENGTHKFWKEKLSTWASRQNFSAPSKWNKRDKEIFADSLADEHCADCETGFQCSFEDFESEWRRDVVAHFLKFHRGYILAAIRYCRPRPIEFRNAPGKNR